ncbi:MAG: aminodeoxychorismate lyase [Gammaproteobacteria bacterium]|nr:aminodeoxychorismate lyase [Gammaproteobacteria bacterium]
MSTARCLVDGRIADTVAATDRGFAYGDGLFETIACRDGRPLLLDHHFARLARGCARLGLPVPDPAMLENEILALATAEARCVVKLVLSRGAGGRGYRPADEVRPTRVIVRHEWPDHPHTHASRGISSILCATRLGTNARLAGIKHLNRLEQVLASMELGPDAQEGLMLDTHGHVIEGTRCNLFLVIAARLVTPALTDCGVAGVMRAVILEHAARLGMPADVRAVAAHELERAEELFLCNAIIGIWPVRRLVGLCEHLRAPGPITATLARSLRDAGDWPGGVT